MSVYRETREKNTAFTKVTRFQRTIRQSVSVSGVGVFSGKKIEMTFVPADPGTGICFQRTDLDDRPFLAATTDNLKATPRCTILGNDVFQIVCVEHVLSAIASSGIDNILIQVDGGEVPIIDGSALKFMEMLHKAYLQEQQESLQEYRLEKPIYLSDKDTLLIALPSYTRKYSYTLSYPRAPLLDAQFYCFDPLKDSYKENIAPARTFALLEEVKVLIEKKIINSECLDHGVIIDGDKILNPDGLRFSNEMARHKILDMIGDFALAGAPICAHFIAVKSGHYLNTQLAEKLRHMIMENE
ncbi:MAG: UDP-3-O-acyl-N-acetylglucosamine deacetylase [Chlamydiia bacterium]|nr:UDP-3-O-acyl-N-acetylglucosamine deacetylase [Chlamydiia bacterium]